MSSRRGSILDSSISGSPWHFLTRSSITPVSASIFTWPSPYPPESSHDIVLCVWPCSDFSLLIRTSVICIRAHINDLILIWFCLQGYYFQIRSYFRFQGLGLQHTFCGGDMIQTYSTCHGSYQFIIYSLTVPDLPFIVWLLPWAASQQSTASGYLLVFFLSVFLVSSFLVKCHQLGISLWMASPGAPKAY